VGFEGANLRATFDSYTAHTNMDIKTIYEDEDVMVVDKPAGIVVFPEGQTTDNTLIDTLIEKYPTLKNVGETPRYGIVHRLDKDTSGVLLVAKSNEGLIFFQKQFKNREVEKKYVCLVEGDIKTDKGKIETLIGRAPGDKRKQKVYSLGDPNSTGKREAITEYKVLERYKDYTLLEVEIKTGRRHQIRCHFSYLKHPIAGDKLYNFKNSKIPEGLTRQFLHAQKLKIQLPSGETKEFLSELPDELQKILIVLEK
jgi:23S rRNA pseudouridine1911/1915/1917 synthase